MASRHSDSALHALLRRPAGIWDEMKWSRRDGRGEGAEWESGLRWEARRTGEGWMHGGDVKNMGWRWTHAANGCTPHPLCCEASSCCCCYWFGGATISARHLGCRGVTSTYLPRLPSTLEIATQDGTTVLLVLKAVLNSTPTPKAVGTCDRPQILLPILNTGVRVGRQRLWAWGHCLGVSWTPKQQQQQQQQQQQRLSKTDGAAMSRGGRARPGRVAWLGGTLTIAYILPPELHCSCSTFTSGRWPCFTQQSKARCTPTCRGRLWPKPNV